jgi:hypothetical protein
MKAPPLRTIRNRAALDIGDAAPNPSCRTRSSRRLWVSAVHRDDGTLHGCDSLNHTKRPCERLALANIDVEAASGVHYSSRVVALESSQWIAYRQWPAEV